MALNFVHDLIFPLVKGYSGSKRKATPLESLIIEGQEVFDTEGEPLMLKVGKRKFNEL